MQELSFYDVKTKSKFTSSDYRIAEKKGRFFAVTKSKAGSHECWRVLSKDQAEKLKKQQDELGDTYTIYNPLIQLVFEKGQTISSSLVSSADWYCWKGFIIVKKVPATSLKLAKLIASYTSDMKAENIAILDMRKVVNFCDYFVLCTGNSSRQVRAIADYINEKLTDLGQKICFKQGFKDGRWILIDLGTVVTHIFDKETRGFYELDYRWKEAKRILWE